MKTNQIFPAILIFLMLCAAVGYGISGDWRKTVYWIAGAILNIVVTF